MKPKHLHFPSNLLATAVTAGAVIAGLALTSAQESIVIEGGPNPVQISDQDGEPEPVRPTLDSASIPAPTVPTDNPESVTVRPMPTTDVQVLVPTVEQGVTDPTEIRPLGQREKATLSQVEVKKAKMLDSLRDDLGIANSATEAEVRFAAEDLFDRETTQFLPKTESTFQKLGDYLELSDHEMVSVLYLYAPDEETESQARMRSAALASHLDEEADLNSVEFTLQNPEVVRETVTENGGTSEPLETYKSIVVLSMR